MRNFKKEGQRFGALVIVKVIGRRSIVKCDCSVTKEVFNCNLGARTVSCGCYHRTKNGLGLGKKKRPNYKTWIEVKRRIFSPTYQNFDHYGGRGLTMEPGWVEDFDAFDKYLNSLTPAKQAGNSLDRKDNNLGYVEGNLRWADKSTQQTNRRTVLGIEKNLSYVAEKYGISLEQLRKDLYYGDKQ